MRGTMALLTAVALVGIATPAPSYASGHSERLAARARRGDRIARTRLVEEHMGLVRSIAYRYRDLGLPIEDLVQEGAIGLLAAIDDYDAGCGASFSTHAFWRVRAAVTHALTAHGQLVRVPRPLVERRRTVAQTREHLTAAGREPSFGELAEATGLSPRELAEALAPAAVASLDQPDSGGTILGELVGSDPGESPEVQAVAHDQLHALRRAVRRLRGRKRTIISRHFGLAGRPETLVDIAGDLQLSAARTRALKDEALRELAADLEPAGRA